jgi:two-component system NtrC family response regulator
MTTKPKLLIVDDDEEIRTQMKWALAGDYEIILAADRAGAMEAFVADRPPGRAAGFGPAAAARRPRGGAGHAGGVDRLGEPGQSHRHHRPGRKGDRPARHRGWGLRFHGQAGGDGRIEIVLKRVFHVAQLEREIREMQRQARPDIFEGMLGTSAAMRGLFDMIRKVATTDAPVLLLGESGTGKEMAAQAIHQMQPPQKGAVCRHQL